MVDYKSFVDSDDEPDDAFVGAPRSRLPMEYLPWERQQEREQYLERIAKKTALTREDYRKHLRHGAIPGRDANYQSKNDEFFAAIDRKRKSIKSNSKEE
eukprot:UN00691